MSDDQNSSALKDVMFILGFMLLVVTPIIAMFAGFATVMNNGEQAAGERACAEAYGENATYVGDTGFGSSTGICDVGDEQRYVDVSTELGDYRTALGDLVGGVIP